MVAIVASPSPGSVTASARARNHLTYKNMILSAIEALKDPGGSSLNAISNFILENYSDLPPSHASLVAYYLRRLGSNGEVIMENHCYRLPPSVSAENNGVIVGSKRRGRPRKKVHSEFSVDGVSQKRRGRPPKLRGVAEVTLKRRSGRRPKTSDRPAAAVDSTPVYVLQQDEQLKSALLQIFRRATSIVLPEGFLNEKAVRAPVLILPTEFRSLIGGTTGKSNLYIRGVKRKPGRPRKNSSDQKQESIHLGAGKRKPGRPKKIVNTLLPRIIASSDVTLKKTEEPKSPESAQAKQATAGVEESKRKKLGVLQKKHCWKG
ncbi:hypothetical protein HPP92_003159 [Vanilla planifolia]|uniref:H15 domain-containing protein n=1 Tax=Vanilla planifolia TaxID=51239 RepID=A0A835SFY2_VANPL|nr:hypothetical protein HPP92_003159 [Vanilla planifolia]